MFFFTPILNTFWLSFTDLKLSAPKSGVFVGLKNYIEAFGDTEFRAALGRTLLFAVSTVPRGDDSGFACGIGPAPKIRRTRICAWAHLLPWALPYVVNGAMWKWIFNANYGALNALLLQSGLIDNYQIWLGNPKTAFLLVTIANIWKETPVAAILIHAALQGIPEELYEAAWVDGAGSFRRFLHITLPILRPVIAVTMVVKTVWALKEFDLIYVITGGRPGKRHQSRHILYLFDNVQVSKLWLRFCSRIHYCDSCLGCSSVLCPDCLDKRSVTAEGFERS